LIAQGIANLRRSPEEVGFHPPRRTPEARLMEFRVLLSMTGYGEARCQGEPLSLSIELRALNNRYLKVSLRAPDPYHLLEAEFEKVIRRTVKRGTIQVHLRCERQAAAE